MLDIRSLDDWYSFTIEDIKNKQNKVVNRMLEHIYNSSLPRALQSLYPSHNWKPWLFKESVRLNVELWEDSSTVRSYLNWIAAGKLKVASFQDWYQVYSTSLNIQLVTRYIYLGIIIIYF